MITASYAYETAVVARSRGVKRDDIYAVESFIRERADAGWFTLSLAPFSVDGDRAEYVARLLRQNGYNVTVVATANTFGLDIDWFSKEETVT